MNPPPDPRPVVSQEPVEFQMDTSAEPGNVLPVLVRLLRALDQQRQAEVLSKSAAGEEDRQE